MKEITQKKQGDANPDILIVDDDISVVRLLRISLKRIGYHVRSALNGMEALKEVKNSKPDAIILDVLMPEVDGLSLLEKFKSESHTEDIPVILLTVRKDQNDIKAGYDLGADYYITKPFKVENIIDTVRRATADR